MSDSTALATTEMQIAIMQERAAETERNAFDFIPQRIKMPSGGLQVFTLSDGDTMKPFTGIIAVSQKSRAYWPDRETQGLPPLCSSPDGLDGWFADEPDATVPPLRCTKATWRTFPNPTSKGAPLARVAPTPEKKVGTMSTC